MDFRGEQIILINKVKSFFKNSKKNFFYYQNSHLYYFLSHGENSGNALINLWEKKISSFLFFLKVLFKKFYNLLFDKIYDIKMNKNLNIKNYKNLVITWGFKNSFKKNNLFYDKYFNITSKKNILWIVVYLDKNFPRKIPHNCILFYLKKKKKKFSNIKKIIGILKVLFSKEYLYSLYWNDDFAEKFCNKILPFFNNSNFQRLLIPYEGQPFQNLVIKKIKKINKSIKVIGYIHTYPAALPINYIYKPGSPDYLILNSTIQYKCFYKHLGWKKSKLKILPSARFQKIKKNMKKKIFLPYSIMSKKKFFKNYNYVLKLKKFDFLKFLTIVNHPAQKNSKKHILIEKKLKQNFINNNNNKIKSSIFFGATSAPLEAICRGVESFHVSDNPIKEIYSNKIYPGIQSKKIANNIYKYENNKKIYLFGKKSIFNKYLNLSLR